VAVKLEATGKLSCHGSMYLHMAGSMQNVTDRPQEPARLKQESFAKETRVQWTTSACIWARRRRTWLLRPARIKFNGERLPAVSPGCAEREKKLGNHRCTTVTTLVLNDGDFHHPCNHQILASLPGTVALQ
jgi:hypothetical protein